MTRRLLGLALVFAGVAGAQYTKASPFVVQPNGSASWTSSQASWIASADTTYLYVGPSQRYTTVDAAIAAATTRNKPSVIELDPAGTYTSAGGTWPAIWIEVRGNGATVTNSGAITVTASYRAYDLNVVGNVVYAGASTDRYYLTGGSRTGNVTLTTGLLHDEGTTLLSGAVTVNGGTFECISTTITSTISHTAGNLLLQNTNVNATKSTALITSTATSTTSSFQIVNSLVTNLGTGTTIDISANTQATAHANALANTILTTASAASMIAGSAVLEVTDCDYTVAPTGTGYTGTNWGMLGGRSVTGDLVPTTTATRALGTSALAFKQIYLAPAYGIGGVTTAVNASAGYVGEVISSAIASGSAVTFTSGTAANVTSISLTAGDWDVSANINFVTASATMTVSEASINTTSATHSTDGTENYAGVVQTSASLTSSANPTPKRINVSATTTTYLVGTCAFSGTSCKGYGTIRARRVR